MVISPILVAVQIFFGPGGHWMSEGKRPNLGSLEGEKKSLCSGHPASIRAIKDSGGRERASGFVVCCRGSFSRKGNSRPEGFRLGT